MDYEATLSALMGLLGEDVTVVIGGARGRAAPEHIATFAGELTAAQDLGGDDDADPEALFFQVGAGEGSGFLVERALFREAYWSATRDVLAVYLGDLKIEIAER